MIVSSELPASRGHERVKEPVSAGPRHVGNLGQAVILEFLIFFIIGIAVFIGIGNYFKIQSEILRQDVAPYSVQLVNNYLSSIVVMSVEGCKKCDVVENRLKIGDSVFGYFLLVNLDETGISIMSLPPALSFNSSLNRLNESVAMNGSSPSIRQINITYNGTAVILQPLV